MTRESPSVVFDIALPEGSRREAFPRDAILKVGRDARAHLRLDHPSVSRIHAVLEPEKDGTLGLIDLGSENGTWVNGERATRVTLAHGDTLLLGDVSLRVWFDEAPEPEPSEATPAPVLEPSEATPDPVASPTEDAPNPLAEALIAELEGGGAPAEGARFTLDRERARQEMRKYQLADPDAFVLQLVRAAVLKGATRMEFQIDSDDLVLRHDGAPFTREDFEGVYDAMFIGGAETPEVQARQALALALTAASALSPRFLRVTSGDGAGDGASGAELLCRPGEPDAIVALSSAPEGTTVHMRCGLGAQVRDLAERALGNSSREELLRSRCQYGAVPIWLNGSPISGDAAHPFAGLEGIVRREEGDLHIVGGFLPRAAFGPTLRLVQHGVWFAQASLGFHGPGFVAVASSPRFRLDLGQANVVQDEAYAEAVAAAASVCGDSFQAFCRSMSSAGRLPEAAFWWGTDLVRGVLLATSDLALFRTDDEASLFYWVARVPLWREQLAGGFAGRSLSLRDLWALTERGQRIDTVLFSDVEDSRLLAFRVRPGVTTLRITRPDDRKLLIRLRVIE